VFGAPRRRRRLTRFSTALGRRIVDSGYGINRLAPFSARSLHSAGSASRLDYSPIPVGLPELVRVAGPRWTVEESFHAGKGLTGPDELQVRRWTLCRRWILVALLASGSAAAPAVPNFVSKTPGRASRCVIM